MTARIMMFIILCVIVRRTVSIAVPWANIARYVFASAVMGATLFVIPHPTRMHLTLIYTALGGLFYLTLLMLIDEEARALFKAVWNEIKFMLGR